MWMQFLLLFPVALVQAGSMYSSRERPGLAYGIHDNQEEGHINFQYKHFEGTRLADQSENYPSELRRNEGHPEPVEGRSSDHNTRQGQAIDLSSNDYSNKIDKSETDQMVIEKRKEENVEATQEIKEKVKEEKKEIEDEAIFGEKKVNVKPGIVKSCKVLVLGAGMAGISAAKTLKSLGVDDILVVEGASRIGGRVKDVDFGGITVEVGANWVHFANMNEETVNPVEVAVRDAGLNLVQDGYDDLIYRYKGRNVTEEANEAQERFDEVLEGAVQVGKRKVQFNEPDVNFRVSLALQDWRPVTPIESAVEFFNFDFEFADEPSDTGLKDNFKIYEHHSKDDLFVADKRGYSHIIYRMAHEIGLEKDENLFLNEYVTEINYDEEGDKKVKVVTKNSRDETFNIFRADYVICTFSIGVLQSDFVKFNPKLPAWKEETIYMYKMTRYIKIFAKFPSNIEAFWDDNHYIFYVDPSTRGRYQLWQNLEARGKYFPKGTNMLLITVLGNNWERVKNLEKKEIIAELYEVLKSMYGDKAVAPEDILIPDWHSNPLFFGAYSNWPIGISKTTYQNLDAPVGRFYMAGEACSPNYSGYLHGAMESGELTARNLHKCMTGEFCEAIPTSGYGYNQKPDYMCT